METDAQSSSVICSRSYNTGIIRNSISAFGIRFPPEISVKIITVLILVTQLQSIRSGRDWRSFRSTHSCRDEENEDKRRLRWLSQGSISGSQQNQDYHQQCCFFLLHHTLAFSAHCSLFLMNHQVLPTSFLAFLISVSSFPSPLLSPNPGIGYPSLEDYDWLTSPRAACLSSFNPAAMKTKVISKYKLHLSRNVRLHHSVIS